MDEKNNLVEAQSFIVCAFYTDGYLNEVQALKQSLEEQGLPYDIRRYESRGVWEANTRIKPEFLLACLEKHPSFDIVYIDADAVVRKPLKLFDKFDSDIGVFIAPADEGFSHQYLTGTLYLRNTLEVKAFIESWINAQIGMVVGVDQDSFGVAIAQHAQLKVYPLPTPYIKIYDRGDDEPVIEHFQASRTRIKLARLLKKIRNTTFGVAIIGAIVWLFDQI